MDRGFRATRVSLQLGLYGLLRLGRKTDDAAPIAAIEGWGIGVNTPEPILRVMRESDPDVCLLASQYPLIGHANALTDVFHGASAQREVRDRLVADAGFISGSPRYTYGKTHIPRQYIEKTLIDCGGKWAENAMLICGFSLPGKYA
jgi:hypothetical protein